MALVGSVTRFTALSLARFESLFATDSTQPEGEEVSFPDSLAASMPLQSHSPERSATPWTLVAEQSLGSLFRDLGKLAPEVLLLILLDDGKDCARITCVDYHGRISQIQSLTI